MLNIFYKEPDPDRWLPFDRFPRRVVRRLVRGPARPGGHARVFLNLCAGLDKIGVRYRVNDFRRARREPGELACIVGKPFLLDAIPWENPILFGAAVFSHPIDDPNLLDRLPIRQILVPGDWVRKMWEPYWGERVTAWPVGIDTELWRPAPLDLKEFDVLVYDKLWTHDEFGAALIGPIREELDRAGLSYQMIRYGSYVEGDFREALRRCRSMVFLSAHETQGIAYQQALASGVPIMAWNRTGPWRDQSYYPERVVFEPVSSVPYWDHRCGETFAGLAEFREKWGGFWSLIRSGAYAPRDYILENLTLEICARRYADIAVSNGGSIL